MRSRIGTSPGRTQACSQGAEQVRHGFSADRQKLFGYIASHAKALSASDYDDVAFHSLISCV